MPDKGFLNVTIKRPRSLARQADEIFERELRGLGNYAAERLLFRVKEQLDKKKINASGDLEESLRPEVLDIASGELARVTSSDIAASVQEYGSRPAEAEYVNIAEIFEWMKHKPGVTPNWQGAVTIARRIAAEGLPRGGRQNLKRPFSLAQQNARRDVERDVKKRVTVLTGKIERL